MKQIPITETPDIEKEKEMEMEIPMAKRKKKVLLYSPDDNYDDDEAWKRKEDDVYDDGHRYMTREERNRYQTQINESDGFEVDAFPNVIDIGIIQPMWIGSTSSTTFGKIAVQYYNEQSGEGVKLEFVKPLKVNYEVVAGYIYYITFEAKDVGAPDDESRVYQAKVFNGINVIDVFFFRLKDKPNEVFSFKPIDKPRRQEREVQKNFWMEHSADLTVEAMMLDSKASDLDKEERPEVLSLLPPYDGKTVLELGAGIGRFTGELALKASHVLALDFIENVIKKNESINGHHKNVKFMCADVTSPELDITKESMDLIFSNWLLMYLSDKEVETLAGKMIKWLKVGGYVFFRESCFHQSGDFERKYNPTHYREPIFYSKVFKECHMRDESGNTYELSLVGFKCIGAYVRTKKYQNQICWIWRKVQSPDDKGFQKFLDNVQYKCFGILRYERMFGNGFVSTGGIEITKEFVAKLELKPGQKVLDVGCGIGGGDFYMAENFDAEVVGIDLSVDLISFALERASDFKCSVEFEVADCTKKTYPDNTFNVIYSRDTILHIQDKPALFRSFYKWLKPGGKVLISDYCRSNRTPSEEFAEYIKQRGYDLHDVNAYGQMLRDAGFNKVIAEDRTDQFVRVLHRELSTIEKEKEESFFGFTAKDYDDIIDGWMEKLIRCSTGEQRWGLFIAKKN